MSRLQGLAGRLLETRPHPPGRLSPQGPAATGSLGSWEGPSTPAYSCLGLWESQTPCLPTKDGSPAPTPQANHHPSSGLLEACFPRPVTKHRPSLTSAHTLLWALRLTSRSRGLQECFSSQDLGGFSGQDYLRVLPLGNPLGLSSPSGLS